MAARQERHWLIVAIEVCWMTVRQRSAVPFAQSVQTVTIALLARCAVQACFAPSRCRYRTIARPGTDHRQSHRRRAQRCPILSMPATCSPPRRCFRNRASSDQNAATSPPHRVQKLGLIFNWPWLRPTTSRRSGVAAPRRRDRAGGEAAFKVRAVVAARLVRATRVASTYVTPPRWRCA